MSRNAVRVLLILITIGAEILLLITAVAGAIAGGMSGRDGRPFLWLLLGHMPALAIGVVMALTARPWPTRFAIIIGFLLLAIDSALIVDAVIDSLAQGPDLPWLVVLFDVPGVIILAGVWLIGYAHDEPKVIAPPPTGEWR